MYLVNFKPPLYLIFLSSKKETYTSKFNTSMACPSKQNCSTIPPKKEDIDPSMILKLKLKPLLPKKLSVAGENKIIANILSRLPVKTLLRCKSVSKSWLSIISSHDFIKTHLARSADDPHLTHHQLILCGAPFMPKKHRPYIDITVRNENLKLACCPIDYLLNETGPKQIKLDSPTENIDNWTYVVDHCNGLLCLACFDGSVFLWNPSTRNYRQLPKYDHEHEHTVFGFGYNELKDDFKVYAVIGDSFSVYGTNSNCWGMIEDVPTPKLSYGTSKGTFSHGAIHWVVKQGDEKKTIFALDVDTETCRKVLQPDYGEDAYELTLASLGQSLSILCQYNTGADLWVVQDYGAKESWKKLFSFPIPIDLKWEPRIRPLCISEHGDFMLLVGLAVIMYNPKANDNQIRILFETDINPSYNIFQELNVYTYVESLVFPQT